MSPLLILSTIAISAALVFYTWGVFGERRSGTLTRKYVTLFWIGLACDTTGTLMMSSMAAQTAGGMGVHGITGIVAIVLMLIHATWATWTYLRGSEQAAKALPHLQHGGLACLAHPLHHRYLDGYSCDPLESSVRCWYERDRRCDSERVACAPPPPPLSVGCVFCQPERLATSTRARRSAPVCAAHPLLAPVQILLQLEIVFFYQLLKQTGSQSALQFPKGLCIAEAPGCAGNR